MGMDSGIDGNLGRMGNMGSMGGASWAGGEGGRWWHAFGTGGLEGEPSLMEGEFEFHSKPERDSSIVYKVVLIRSYLSS
jgi:hypothetical protein